jgi:hypothetical protein
MYGGISLYPEEMLRKRIEDDICEACILGKHSRTPYKPSDTQEDILGWICKDVSGPMEVESLGGATYFASFVDGKILRSTVARVKVGHWRGERNCSSWGQSDQK